MGFKHFRSLQPFIPPSLSLNKYGCSYGRFGRNGKHEKFTRRLLMAGIERQKLGEKDGIKGDFFFFLPIMGIEKIKEC